MISRNTLRFTMEGLQKHVCPRQAGWLERSFVVESAGSDLDYFTLSGAGGDGTNRARPRRSFLPCPGRCYSFCIPAAPTPRERVRAARLHRTLQHRLTQEPWAARSEVLALLAYSAQGTEVEKGFLVRDKRGLLETERSLEELLNLLLPEPAHLSVYEEGDNGELCCALWCLQGAGKAKELLGTARVVAAAEPEFHPAIPHLLGDAVFSSRETAREVLEECTSLIPEARLILELVDQCPKHPKKGNFPVIVTEGLDATGKTTITHFLKDSLNAVLLKTPPSCVSQWRKIFDDEPTLIRRAFYALSNYIVTSEVAKESATSPVILDRYWHSTAAYAIAAEITGKAHHLPPSHHQVYQWPDDLLSPDIVLLLTVRPEERIRRLRGRGTEKTKEEVNLEANEFFRQKVEECYRRMENPQCQILDANPSREDVAEAALHLIKKQCHFL